ncbi:MAG: hypothetical protein ACO3SP_00040 [Ilumatobacteraceae bacterium]
MTNPSGYAAGSREIKFAWLFFFGTFVALILNGIWSLVVGTASPGADESDLVQGWQGVLRNLPAYSLLVVVASLGVWYATRANVHGYKQAKFALIATSLVLLFALSSVTRDAAEVVMTTRAATMAWATFGVDALLVGVVYVMARRKISRASRLVEDPR